MDERPRRLRLHDRPARRRCCSIPDRLRHRRARATSILARYALLPGGEGDDALFGWPRVIEDRNVIGADSIGRARAGRRHCAWPASASGACPGRSCWRRPLPWPRKAIRLDWFGASPSPLQPGPAPISGRAGGIYLPDGLPPVPEGEGRAPHLPLGELAKTMKHLAAAGPRDFYEGEIARSLVRDLQAAGSAIALDDLADIPRRGSEPALEFEYRGDRIATAARLTAGPSLQRVMQRLGAEPLPGPSRVPKTMSPTPERCAGHMTSVWPATAAVTPRWHARAAKAAPATSRVVDRDGMMVALTQTLLSRFGAKRAAAFHGHPDEQRHDVVRPAAGAAELHRPGAPAAGQHVPRCGAPRRRPWLALGASGGRRILPAVSELLSFVIDYGMDLAGSLPSAAAGRKRAGHGHARPALCRRPCPADARSWGRWR